MRTLPENSPGWRSARAPCRAARGRCQKILLAVGYDGRAAEKFSRPAVCTRSLSSRTRSLPAKSGRCRAARRRCRKILLAGRCDARPAGKFSRQAVCTRALSRRTGSLPENLQVGGLHALPVAPHAGSARKIRTQAEHSGCRRYARVLWQVHLGSHCEDARASEAIPPPARDATGSPRGPPVRSR
jgi:hypothetical protein